MIRVRSRPRRLLRWLWLATTRPVAALWRLIRRTPRVQAPQWVAPARAERDAMARFEALLEKKGHRALGLPTPPKDPKKRRAWIVKMAERYSHLR